MADISVVKLPNNSSYNVKDATARSSISSLTTTVGTKAPLASPALTGTPTAPTAAAGTNTTQIATTAYVMNAFQANDAMLFKGTIGSSGATVTALPNTHYQGWTYKVATAGTYAGKACEIGDMIICVTDGTAANNDHWAIVQTNIDGAVTGPSGSTADHVATFNGTNGKVIKDSGYTIGKSVPSNAVFTDTDTKVTSVGNHYTPAEDSGSKLSVDASSSTAATWGTTSLVTGVDIKRDAKGHVVGISVDSIKMPANPDTNTWRSISDSVSSTSSDVSASSKAVKTAYDLAASKTANTGTVTKVTAGTGLTGGDITTTGTIALAASGVTAGSAGPTAAVTGSNGTTVAIPRITVDTYGRVTGLTSYNLTNVNTDNDTKNTAGSTDTSSKIFLVGATSQAANPQTYSDNEVYATNGVLTTKSVQVGGTAATMQYNATTKSIDFVFA